MRKKDGALRGTLLLHARDLADSDGIDAVNIRSIAQRAGVAAGTVYNYFTNKEEILLALTEEYWKETLLELRATVTADSFCGQLEEIYAFLKKRIDSSAGALMHSLANARTAGQERMASMQTALETALQRRMEEDPRIRADVFTDTFSKEQYARFINLHMTALLRAGAPDLRFLTEIVKRTLY